MIIGTIGNCVTVAQATCTGTGVLKIAGGALYAISTSGLAILTAVIGIAVAYFLFRWGWRKIKGSVK